MVDTQERTADAQVLAQTPGLEDVTDARLELLLQPQPNEEMEWQAQVEGRYTGWHLVESTDHVVELAKSIFHDGDWLTIQTRHLDERRQGRYAQAMNTGTGYQLEVAQVEGSATYNWRIGLGSEADSAGNAPYGGVQQAQNMSLAAVTEVLVSWLRGHGRPHGYGAALHVYAQEPSG